ncbi:glutathione S-transferase family protein [Hydromonas duriensis]|uniref:Glutathione S-transferase n=1 Tax=Hydromonas duriensis TaxID=1527608 RepID=A0A4R6Y7P1_9BURK|nr:glutathione S-transferase family protein [Hydromonas duriensis]TDR31362.1 glutathione S-transferase [Hydromonas duriensis]
MIKLHYSPTDASMTPHIILEELGLPFELVLVDRQVNAQKSKEYLQLNPNGTIPTLVHDDLVLFETAAIAIYLAELKPQAGLVPNVGTTERGEFYKWMFWLANTFHSTLMPYFYAERWVDAGNELGAAEVKSHAQARVKNLLSILDNELARRGQDYLLGEQFSVADVYAFMLCRWTRHFNADVCPPARDWTHIRPYLERILARPAVQRVYAKENIVAPLI